MTNAAKNLEVADTIRAQIGGRAFLMLGAKDLLAIENGLQFKIRGSRNANVVQIVLDASDTYTVTFQKGRGLNWRTVAEVSDVYADSLHRVIESNTGLYTSL